MRCWRPLRAGTKTLPLSHILADDNSQPVPMISSESLRAILVPPLVPYMSRISLFGSAARGEMTESSDIDLLVTVRPREDRPPLGLRFFALEAELTELVGRPVELVTEDALSRYIRPHIEQDTILIYEDG